MINELTNKRKEVLEEIDSLSEALVTLSVKMEEFFQRRASLKLLADSIQTTIKELNKCQF